MNVFRDLDIRADAETMAMAATQIEKRLPPDWNRDQMAEGQTKGYHLSENRPTYCFVCLKTKHRPAAMIVLTQKDENSFYVSNIIPKDIYQLEYAAYIRILEDFYEDVIQPEASQFNIQTRITEAEANLDHWMQESTAQLLRSFSTLANRGTGVSHPSDRKRWNAFLLSAHKTGCTIPPSTLARWLVESEEWAPEIAEQLAMEYAAGLNLLAYATVH